MGSTNVPERDAEFEPEAIETTEATEEAAAAADMAGKAPEGNEVSEGQVGTGGPSAEVGDGTRPVMPRSQPVLPYVAERIIDGARDGGGDDLLSRIVSTKHRVSDALRGHVPDGVADGAGRLAGRVAARATRLSADAAEATARIRGEGGLDTYNLGVEYLRRTAEMVRRISDLSNDGIADDTATMLLDAAEWVDGGYLDASGSLGAETAAEMGVRVARNLDAAWKWLYDNIMTCAVPKPISKARVGMAVDPALVPAIQSPVLSAVSGIGQRLGQGWDDESLVHMSGQGMRDLADALDKFARSTFGWPDDYPESPLLSTRGGDEWPDCQYWDLLSFVHGDAQGAQTTVEREEDGEVRTYHTVRTNREMGLAFCAWTEDCHAAARTLGLWADCNDGTGNSRVLASVMSWDEAEEMKEIRRRTWEWLGEHILDIVC